FDADIRRLFQRLNVLAFGIAAAAEEFAKFAPAQEHGPTALLAGFVDFFLGGDGNFTAIAPLEIFGVLAFRILRAGEELAVAPPLYDHHRAAFLAGDIRGHFLALDVAHLFFRLLEIAREGRVKALHRLGPFLFSVLDLVQLVFHPRRTLDVENIRKTLHQKIGDEKTQIRRRQRAAFGLQHVLAVEYVGNDRRIGRRATDT